MGLILLLVITVLPVIIYFTVRSAAREGTLEALKAYEKLKKQSDNH